MHKFDFLSGEPKTFIFAKNSNKTNLGGVLTLIYLIIIILITIYYLYDYTSNDKYTVTYRAEHSVYRLYKDIEKIYFDDNYNPNISFSIQLGKGLDSNNFEMYLFDFEQYMSKKKINFGSIYHSKVFSLTIYLYYKCPNYTKGFEECKKSFPEGFKTITLSYEGYKLQHQNSKSPIYRDNVSNQYFLSIQDKITLFNMRWKNFIYSEESGIFDKIFGKNNNYYGGEFIDPLIYMSGELSPEEDGKILISIIHRNPDDINYYYDFYTRNKKGIIDVFSTIFSLSLAVYNGFIFVFCKFYSNNFDNYKIIDKLLSNKYNKKNMKKKINKKECNDIENEIDNKNNNMIELGDYNNIDKKEDNLLNKNNIENEIIIEEENENKLKEKENENILPKLHFYHYLLNNIYMKKCCGSYNQDIISFCNEIISKYYSIDNILYNQLLLENLFKDYKWNDPKLNTIENIKLVNDLNLIINN